MAKVVAVGGVFFKSQDPKALGQWYQTHLGLDIQPWGGAVLLYDKKDEPGVGYTVWSPFAADTQYFAPSDKPFMINLRVDDLDGMLSQLREQGCKVLDRREDAPNGKFGYVVDPEGTLLELWEQADPDPYVP
ncbi:MAG: VOC family protein [Sandaracinaceae bacterium]|nr:VOC family protein [Sandaracinaceae bacterium]